MCNVLTVLSKNTRYAGGLISSLVIKVKKKGKAIPVTGYGGL
jgi:hypothetical protein